MDVFLSEKINYNTFRRRILGARNIPLSQIRLRHKELRKDQPVYLYCQSGFRTGRAAQYLKKQGYKDFYQLQGGFKTWTGKIKKK